MRAAATGNSKLNLLNKFFPRYNITCQKITSKSLLVLSYYIQDTHHLHIYRKAIDCFPFYLRFYVELR
jgi:hypothetical protein